MQITENQLHVIMPHASNEAVTLFVQNFNKYADSFSINTPLRAAHFLAQIAVESGELQRVTENLSYSANRLMVVFPKYFKTATEAKRYQYHPQLIGNRVYANRMGNGDEKSGDGYNYRGRGFIQITGKDNYRAYGQWLRERGMQVDLVASPFLLSDYPGCLKSAMWFFSIHGCNKLADANDVTCITKKINGGTNGLDKRKQYFAVAKQALRA